MEERNTLGLVLCSGNLMRSQPFIDVKEEVNSIAQSLLASFCNTHKSNYCESSFSDCPSFTVDMASPPPSPPLSLARICNTFVDKTFEPCKPEERSSLLVSVKLFVSHEMSTLSIDEAVHSSLKLLKIQSIDHLIVCVPSAMPLERLVELWNYLGTYVKLGFIGSLGITEFPEFESFCSAVMDQPKSYHVRGSFHGKSKDIEIISLSDPAGMFHILTKDLLDDFLKQERKLKEFWMLRYSFLIKCRNVLSNRGYIFGIFAE